MFDANYANLPEESQARYREEERTENLIENQNQLFLHRDAVLLKAPLKLIGKGTKDCWRIKHPSLKYQHVPIEFLSINEKASSLENYYKVNQIFSDLKKSDISNLCIYFGIFANPMNGETKCKNHAHCQDFHSFLFTEGIHKYIEDCNTLEKQMSFDVTYTMFTNSSSFRTHVNNASLAKKIKNCFWLESNKEMSSNRVVGNVIVPKGQSCFPLISTIVGNVSYEIKMNASDNGNHPEIISARIFNSKVYINALEAVELTLDIPLGSVSSINLDVCAVPSHKLVTFEIRNFKQSNWPVRAITDATISFFMESICPEVVLHWSYCSPLVRKVYCEYLEKYPEVSISKQLFLETLDKFKEHCSVKDEESIAKIKDSLNNHRSFWFLAPKGFDLKEYSDKLSLLLENLKMRKNLPFVSYESEFNAEDQVNDIYSIKTFFNSTNIIKGDISLLLMKPNFMTLKNLKLFKSIVSPVGRIVKFEPIVKLPDEQFNTLYENCLKRPYGAAWKEYITSGPCIACIFVSDNMLVAREKIIDLREASGVVWIKNIAHFSSSKEEATRDLNCFFPNYDLVTLNGEMLKLHQATQPILQIQNDKAENEVEMFDDNGLPSNFPPSLKQNADIVQFMKYIAEQTKRPTKRSRIN
jgi:hypothetical protein